MAPQPRVSDFPKPTMGHLNHTVHCNHTLNSSHHHHNHTHLLHGVVNSTGFYNHTHHEPFGDHHNCTEMHHNFTHPHNPGSTHRSLVPRAFTKEDGHLIGWIILTVVIVLLLIFKGYYLNRLWCKYRQGRWAKGQGSHFRNAAARKKRSPAREYISNVRKRISTHLDNAVGFAIATPTRAHTRSTRGFNHLESTENIPLDSLPSPRTAATEPFSFASSSPEHDLESQPLPPAPTLKSWAWNRMANKGTTSLGRHPTTSTAATNPAMVPLAPKLAPTKTRGGEISSVDIADEPEAEHQTYEQREGGKFLPSVSPLKMMRPQRSATPFQAIDRVTSGASDVDATGRWANGGDLAENRIGQVPSYYYSEGHKAEEGEKDEWELEDVELH